jgi:hypothetical protein
MKKTIIIGCAFLAALSIVTASGQSLISSGGSGIAAAPASFAGGQGSSMAIRATPQVSTGKNTVQLQKIDLQNTLQKQQQTLQMLSNISKTLFDSAQATIRKIGG